jgi:hypothetical protein
VDRFAFCLLLGGVFSLPENVRPTSLEVAAKSWVRRPPVTDDRSREVLAEDFCGNITPSTLPDRVQRMVLGGERSDPRLFAVAFDSSLVNVDNVGLLDLAANLLVLTATGARSALGRIPRRRTRQFQFVELLKAVADLPVGKAVIVPGECCLYDDVHPELPLIGAVGV